MFDVFLYLFLAYAWGSISEWVAHRYLMHRNSILPDVFAAHTAHHVIYNRHNFFINTFVFEEHDKSMFSGLVLCLEHVFLFMLPPAIIALPFNPMCSLVFFVFGIAHFFFYNKVHPGMHLCHDLFYIPRWYREWVTFTHFMHHQHPSSFFCVTLPGADYLFGTTRKPTFSDKKDWLGVRNMMDSFFFTPKEDFEEIKNQDNCFLSTNYMENGWVGPKPDPRARKIANFLVKLIVDVFVGKCVEIKGQLPQEPGPYVYACSHNSWADIFTVKTILPDVRPAAAQSVMKFLGLGFLLGPLGGCFSVAPGGGVAVKAGVEILKSGQDVMICPEGWAYMDNTTYPFASGALRMARESNSKIVPMYIDYHYKRSSSFLDLWFPLQVLLDALDFTKPRKYTIIIGEPVDPHQIDLNMLEYKVKKLGGYCGF